MKSKFYIYSRLPLATILKEFNGAEVEYFQKQKNSNAEMAKIVKNHIDMIYKKESESI